MSSENDEQSSPESPIGRSAPESFTKKHIVRYTRDFLLSISGLDVCKKLPDGFDKSVLSDLEEAAITTFERQRSVGSLSLQGSRRGEYGSQSLNRADVSIGYTRGSAGRWEVRSSGSSEREGDFQPEWESSTHDTGRRFGSQNRRSWQNPEHDGLLGSGAFARPSGYAGAQALRSRGDVQLSRSTEPYQPPRPYKAVAYSRKDSNDLCNEETFGSTESSSEDRVEEERKRRESFELMRKEQRKALQEKHNKDGHKGNMDADIIALLENSDADKCTKNRCKLDEPPASSVCQTSSSVSSSNHVPVIRPLVPPGFGTVQLEKNHSARSGSVDKNSVLLSTECDQEVDNLDAYVKMNLPINKQKGMPASSADENECPSAPSSVESVIACNNFSLNATALQEVHKVQEVGIQNETFPEKMEGCDTVTVVSEEHSSSILGKLFGNAMAKNSDGLANDVQNHINGADVAPWTNGASGSSKFFHLFHEEIEEKKARDLLHLIVSDDNLNSQVCVSSKDEVAKQMNSTQHSENFVTTHISTVVSSISGVPADSYRSDDKQNLSCVLTCEDLEQSILAVVKESSSVTHSMEEPRTLFDGKFKERKDNVDDNASQHLLSLLQRGANSKETHSSPRLDAAESDEMLAFSDAESSLHLQINNNIAIKISEEEHSSDKRLTLEALFGTAFMNELHSTEAPVSTHRASAGRVSDSGAIQSHELPFYPSDCQSTTYNGQHSNHAILQAEVLQLSKATEHTVSHTNAVNFAGYADSGQHGLDLGDVAFEGAAGDIHLPEEDSLISLNDSLDPMASGSFHLNKEKRNVPLVHEKTVGDHSSNLLHSFLRDGERSRDYTVDYRPLVHASHEMVEVGGPFIHPHGRQSSPFAQQMNHGRPLLAAHLDHQPFRNPHMFLRQDAMHHDPRHHFAQNVFDHPVYNNIRGSQFDPFVHHPLLQSNAVAGNFLQQNPVQGLPRAPMSQLNHAPTLSHEINNLQAFQLHHRRPNNYGGPGVGTPGLFAGGSGRPTTEVLERMFEMEMRANSKQFHPAMAGHVSGMHASELDINSRYL